MSYRMPAEWEPHEGTWIAWPHNKDHWPGKFGPIPGVFAEMIASLTQSEKVFLLVNDKALEAAARKEIAEKNATLDQVEFVHIPTDTSWTRDYGPIFVRNEKNKLVITDWIFNSWGGKYKPWNHDDVVPKRIVRQCGLPCVEPGIVLEGGSLEVNGKGTLLTAEQCLLNKNRNPQLTRGQIEKYLNDYLGASHVVWLNEGIVGDDTDGHIDDIARFVNPTTIVCAIEENRRDENYEILQKNFETLKAMRDQNGNPFNVVAMPMPAPVIYGGQRLPASYMNFYIANDIVLVPTFRCRKDKEVLGFFAKLFPQRAIEAIDCTDLIWGLGAIHCSTQQQPMA